MCAILQLRTLGVTAQAGTEILGNNGRDVEEVGKELCYGKTETLDDAEKVARWWQNNLI
jgi:hypothetical protein